MDSESVDFMAWPLRHAQRVMRREKICRCAATRARVKFSTGCFCAAKPVAGERRWSLLARNIGTEKRGGFAAA